MNNNAKIFSAVVAGALFFMGGSLFAQLPEESARESEAKVIAMATTSPTPQMIMEKVDQVVALFQEKGKEAWPYFRGKESEFVFAGTYLWIHDEDGVMRMHPTNHKLEGKNLMPLRDANGKRFFVQMNKTVKERGAGWVDYVWPKPGQKRPSQRISYVKGATVDGKHYVVGCCVYGMSEADMNTLLKAK